jgi:hypothetical protein
MAAPPVVNDLRTAHSESRRNRGGVDEVVQVDLPSHSATVLMPCDELVLRIT